MLRKLILIAAVFCVTDAMAQKPKATEPKTTQKTEDKFTDYKQPGAPLPPFVLIPYYKVSAPLEGRKAIMTNADFDNGANLFVMMFNPTCGHCQEEALNLGRNAELFKKSKVVLAANMNMEPYLDDFITITHVDTHPFMYLGKDSSGLVGNLFLYQMLPQINIYDGERKLIKSYTGDVAIDTLKKYIQ